MSHHEKSAKEQQFWPDCPVNILPLPLNDYVTMANYLTSLPQLPYLSNGHDSILISQHCYKD